MIVILEAFFASSRFARYPCSELAKKLIRFLQSGRLYLDGCQASKATLL